tara:strand:+ start:635 stop:1354 length:720 start_codon:yes stop_codon:yes gene_type:complete
MKNQIKYSMNNLIIIPARKGSKGIPNKNLKEFFGKPLIYQTLNLALKLTSKDNIILTTDCDDIIDFADSMGLKVPFKRPKKLANDKTAMDEVIKHAIFHVEKKSKIIYDNIILLQPTSPLRQLFHVLEALKEKEKYNSELIIGVSYSDSNPYYNLVEEDKNGDLKVCIDSSFTRRQDAPIVYKVNGAIYIFDYKKYKESFKLSNLKMKKYIMEPEFSIDIDTFEDLEYAEYIMKKINKK